MDPTRVTAAVPTPSHPLQTFGPGAQRTAVAAANREVKSRPSKWEQSRQAKSKACPAAEQIPQGRPLLLSPNLRLRRLCRLRPKKHGPDTCEPSPEKVDCSRATLRNLLTSIPRVPSVASAMILMPETGKCRRSHTAHRDNSQPPLSVTFDHETLPLHRTD
jgi:hypothetical protein